MAAREEASFSGAVALSAASASVEPVAEPRDGTPTGPHLRGVFRVGSRIGSENGAPTPIHLGVLRAFPASPEEDARSGQWILWVEEELPTKAAMFLVEIAARLGIVPVHFSTEFETRLTEPSPICIVADTNTLYHGSLAQALSLRQGLATHVALADQVLMELQKQRETAYAPRAQTRSDAAKPTESDLDRWLRSARRATFLAAGARALERLRAAGHIVHVARPPEAMVRYFGGGRHAGENVESDENADIVGSNALRDRLILEAAIRQRIALPGVEVWLLTDDANLAAQARIEGLSVGFSWLPVVPTPRVFTSPYIAPRTMQFCHVAAEELLDELVWSLGTLVLQPEGHSRVSVSQVPEERRARMLSAMGEPGYHLRWTMEANAEPWSLAGTLPQKAPAPKLLIETLIAGLGERITAAADEASRYAVQYLTALGWVDKSGELTSRGRQLAESWGRLEYDNVEAWAGWLDDAGSDVRRLGPIVTALEELRARPSATDAELAAKLGVGVRTIGAQLVFASGFGLSVRLGRKGRIAGEWTPAKAESAVFTALTELLQTAPQGVTAVNVAKLFTHMQRPESPEAMPFHVFRCALVRLEAANKVVFGGSNPDSAAVTVHVLMPAEDGRSVRFMGVNLASGDNIVPQRAARIVQPKAPEAV